MLRHELNVIEICRTSLSLSLRNYIHNRARICKRLKIPGIDSALRNRFLGSLNVYRLQIRAQEQAFVCQQIFQKTKATGNSSQRSIKVTHIIAHKEMGYDFFKKPLSAMSLLTARSISITIHCIHICWKRQDPSCETVLTFLPHCKDKTENLKQIFPEKGNIGASVPISIFMCLWTNYIFPRWVCLSAGRNM